MKHLHWSTVPKLRWHMYGTTLAHALSFWLASLDELFMWSLKGSFESKTIPTSSLLFSDMVVLSSLLALTLSFPENSICFFLLFVFMSLKSNHWRKTSEKYFVGYMLIEKNLEELTIGDKYINKRVLLPSEFHTPNDVFLLNNMLRKKKYLAKLCWASHYFLAFEKLCKIKNCWQGILSSAFRIWLFNINIWDMRQCIHHFFHVVRNQTSKKKNLLELIKRRSKVHDENMSRDCALKLAQWLTFFENYKSIKIWLLLVYKNTGNNFLLSFSTEFIQIQKRYYLDQMSVLTWRLLVISS